MVLPSCSHVTKLLIEHHHVVVGHYEISYTWMSLRQKYWVIKGSATVRKILGQSLYCKGRNCSFSIQFMAYLPRSRVANCHPCFYFTRVDFLGRFSLGLDEATSSDTGLYLRASLYVPFIWRWPSLFQLHHSFTRMSSCSVCMSFVRLGHHDG